MSKKSKKEKLFSRLATEWIERTWLGWWKIDISFYDKKEYCKLMKGLDPLHSVALCSTQWKYMQAHLAVNSDALKNCNKHEIEYIVVHELMHVFLNEAREKGLSHEERVATILAKSFILCRQQETGHRSDE